MQFTTLGIIGGGQLGSLLATAAKKLEIKTVIFCDDINAPAQKFADQFIFGSYNDKEKIKFFLDSVDKITFEFENIPFSSLNEMNNVKTVLPNPKAIKILQNRTLEKDFLNNLSISTTQYVSVSKKADLESNQDLLPGIIKTLTLGYDGKGQFKITDLDDLKLINLDFKKKYILEKLIKLKKEISVIITRFGQDRYEIYEPIENYHEDQILRNSKIPANINNDIKKKSLYWAKLISDELKYVGTLCVEYFLDKNDNLYVNEIAPRVHNSGHLTINSHNISQFENHIRAVCGLEKIETKKIYNAEMINVIGEDILTYRSKKLEDNEYFYDYLKNDIKKKRKMGHITKIFK
tara:strand:- start:160 stop:1206 length:1047 start_codon:yes stop_codon:yes gene_type:complete